MSSASRPFDSRFSCLSGNSRLAHAAQPLQQACLQPSARLWHGGYSLVYLRSQLREVEGSGVVVLVNGDPREAGDVEPTAAKGNLEGALAAS